MTMRPDIILGVQQPDFVNTLAQSTRAAGMANQNKRQNALAQVYQDHGPGIANGDKNALNVLAQHDPMAALSVNNTISDNRRADRAADMREQEFGMRRQEFDQRIAEYRRQIGEAEAAKKAATIRQAVSAASAARTPQEWDQVVQQVAGDDARSLIGRFNDREAIFRTYMTIADALDRDTGPKPMSGPGKVQADINAGLLPEDTPLRNGPLVQIGDAPGGKPRTVDPNTIEASDAFDGSDTEGALSVSGIGADLLNTIGEAAWLGQAAPEIDKAQTALNSLSTKTMLGLSAEFPGRPSNLTRERIEELTIRPSELKTGPGRARNKTQDMLRTLEGSIAAANAVMLDPIYSRQDKAQAQTALRQLSQLFADYKALEQSLQAGNADDDIDAIADKWAD